MIREGDNLAARDQLRDTTPGDHQDKRRHDRLNAEDPYQQTVPGPGENCHRERGGDDRWKGNSRDVD